ncbi:von Willebrand factor A domain-containing protein 2 isoform X2 [Vombatus ursinus]|uniref:von Willebrand factor A domain-containing protein 2 isoform X2 n=1 Tax=Vombatus ursinus TaxID=29139 RepID=UPI000FFD8C32|nr:von Willebrand factor A domain-containing protein 2 isoform X2 [Vombatus ursinus]
MNLILFLEAVCVFLFGQVLPSFTFQELYASQETIVKISAASQLMHCSAALDVLLALDGSHSIGKGSFERSKYFAIKLCDALAIGPDRVRVGVLQFSSAPQLEFSLDSFSTQEEVKEKIKKIIFKGGSTETGLALKYLLHKGFPGGRNSSVPQTLVIVTDGKSQGDIALPAKQLKEKGVVVFAVGVKFPRWTELHTLASEPKDQYMLSAEHVDDATNGLYSTLSSLAICNATAPGCRIEPHLCERKTLETIREVTGNSLCWRGSKKNNAVFSSLCPFSSWKKVFITHLATCYRTVCPDPCDSQPCQNGGTCVLEGLDKYHCLCPIGFGGEANCAPKLSLECSVNLLFLLDSSSGTTLEGFLQAKAFLKRFVQAVVNMDSPVDVAVAQYSQEVEIPIQMGQYQDVPSLMKSLDRMRFTGGATLTGRALEYVADHGFRATLPSGEIHDPQPQRVVVLLTDSRSQDLVAGPVRYARDQKLFLIGVGSEFLRAELEEITGNPKQVITYSNPQDLFNKIPELQKKICSLQRPGCQSQSLDLVFLLDASATVGQVDFTKVRSFVRGSSLQFNINRDVTQIGLVVYGSRVQTTFALDTHPTSSNLLQAINQAPYVGGAGSTGSALLHVYDEVMTVQKGARPGVSKAVVVITEGTGTEDAVVPAQKLRRNGISVLVIGVGPVLKETLLRLAGSHDFLIHVPSYEDLENYQDLFIERICEEARKPVNLCKPSPCMNDGTCILQNGSYRCECRGWEGPHCENSEVLKEGMNWAVTL